MINLFGGKFKGYGALKLRVNLCSGGRMEDAGENLRALLQSANTTEYLESSGVVGLNLRENYGVWTFPCSKTIL